MKMARGLQSPSPDQMYNQARVRLPNYSEVIWQPLYDYQVLSASAVSSQRFFATPIGQSNKTIVDTNMQLSGQLSKGQAFMVTGIQVEMYPGVALNTAAQSEFLQDVYNFYNTGALKLTIGSKDYIVQGNLLKFAPVNFFDGFAAVSDTTAATLNSYAFLRPGGREYSVRELLLEPNMSFNVELLNLPALPSTVAGKVGVTLNGFLARNAQ